MLRLQYTLENSGVIMKTFFTLFLLLFLSACENQNRATETSSQGQSWGSMKGLENLVGNMNDTSYSGVRNKPARFNALNQAVPIQSYAGKFLWADYAASWCKTCSKQAPQTKQAESTFKNEVNFITVMTGKSNAYNDHATVATAKSWASQHQLDPQHVFAAKLWFKTIPEHRLFSPEGQTLFVHVGYLSNQEIQNTILHYTKAWREYKLSGNYVD